MRQDADRTLTLALAWIVFGACCVSPILWMLLGSAGSASFLNVASSLTDERQRLLMGNSVRLGAAVTLVACCVGAPVGIVLARCDAKRVWLARVIFALPLALPSYVLALAWIVLFDSALWVYGMPAAVVVLGFSLYPIVMLATEAAIRSVPARFEESARLAASPPRVFFKITLPLIAATVWASLLIVFVLAISDFAVPGLLRVRVYTTEVFTAFAALYDFGRATLMAVPLAAVAALASLAALATMQRPMAGRADRGQAGSRWDDSSQRIAVAWLFMASMALVSVPIGAIAVAAGSGRSGYADVISSGAIRNSVAWSAAGATLVVSIGMVLGYWRAKAAPRAARLADALWVTLFAVPATVIGIGIIAVWNRPGLFGEIYRTDASVIVAYVSRFLPIAALLCGAFVRRVSAGAEEAAIVSGASWIRTFTRIVVPMTRGGFAAVWLLMFILMFGDVALAILVSPPGESNLAVRAYTLIANSPTGDVARLALVQIALTLVPLLAAALLARKHVSVQ